MAQNRDPRQPVRKIIILGASGVGKSAIFKQLRLKYGNSGQFHENEVVDHLNIVRNMYRNFAEQLNIVHGTTGSDFCDHFVANRGMDIQTNFEELANAVLEIWNSENGREVWEDRTVHDIPDTLSYFLQEDTIRRMTSPGFVLTADDILRQNVGTRGIYEIHLDFRGEQLKALSMGGSRGERRKWTHVFEDVSVVFCVLALDDFTKTLFEDPSVNRWKENLDLLSSIVSIKFLKHAPLVVLFTKPDVLEQKVEEFEAQGKNLDEYFPELMLGNDYESAGPQLMEYMEEQVKRVIPEGRSYIMRIVNAIDLETTPEILEGCMEWWSAAENAHMNF